MPLTVEQVAAQTGDAPEARKLRHKRRMQEIESRTAEHKAAADTFRAMAGPPIEQLEDQALRHAVNRFVGTGLRPNAAGQLGPDLGVMGAPAPQVAAGPPVEGLEQAIANMVGKGYIQRPHGLKKGLAGIGLPGGDSIEIPSVLRTTNTNPFPQAQVPAGHQANLAMREQNRQNIGQARGMMRRGRLGQSTPLAEMLARMDDPGQMGQFAQAAVAPQAANVLAQGQAARAAGALAARKQDLADRMAEVTGVGTLIQSYGEKGPPASQDAVLRKAIDRALSVLQGGPAESLAGNTATVPVPGAVNPFDGVRSAESDAALRREWDNHRGGFFTGGGASHKAFEKKMVALGYDPQMVRKWMVENGIADENYYPHSALSTKPLADMAVDALPDWMIPRSPAHDQMAHPVSIEVINQRRAAMGLPPMPNQ